MPLTWIQTGVGSDRSASTVPHPLDAEVTYNYMVDIRSTKWRIDRKKNDN